ncbi:pyridoxal phosphate-dependent aminotransferase [Alloscardovia venturai]|uniref:alanine transaminase n=1 Tax=Alloscardovia venturai TaxID=1769421 RepID=A0ABW2Y4U2_9BIFI
MHFSHRTGDQRLNALTIRSQELKGRGISISHLNDSNPTHFGMSVHGHDFRYIANPRGSIASREILAAYLSRRYGCEINAQQLYLLNSTSQAYAWLMMLLCDPEDKVLYPKPGYPLIESICALTGVECMPYRMSYDGSWVIDYVSISDALERCNYDGAEHPIKAIVLINPNNPTDSYVKSEERKRIVDLCRQYGVSIIADEVFYDFALEPFGANKRLAGESSVLTFALDGFSKMLAAADVKVGWIYVSGPDNEVVQAQQRLDIIADDFLPMSTLITQQIPALLEKADSQTALIHERCVSNMQWLREYVETSTQLGVVSVLRAEGGWSALLRYPSSIEDDELGLALLNQAHAMSAPGYFFDFDSNGYMSISLLPETENFRKNVKTVVDAIERLITAE